MNSLCPVSPCRPVAPYIGGKRNLSEQIARIISATPHTSYAEAFVGMGGVFFRRTMRPQAEIINDYSRDVSNLFRVLQRHPTQFLETLKWQFSGRAEFERLMQTDPDTLTDFERAGRFLYLQRNCYGGKVAHRVFGVAPDRGSRFDLTRLGPMLDDVHDRLSGVVIECLDYKEFLKRYDCEGMLFYLDPPYYGCEADYGRALFSREEFPLMATQLRSLKGRFIVSLNDTPEVREIFQAFTMRQVDTVYSIATHDTVRVKEVLISNYEGVLLHEQVAML